MLVKLNVTSPGKNPVVCGEVSTIEVERGQLDLGLSVVGGCDTPLVCIVVQEVFPEGALGRDGRIQPGDQVLEVRLLVLLSLVFIRCKNVICVFYIPNQPCLKKGRGPTGTVCWRLSKCFFLYNKLKIHIFMVKKKNKFQPFLPFVLKW